MGTLSTTDKNGTGVVPVQTYNITGANQEMYRQVFVTSQSSTTWTVATTANQLLTATTDRCRLLLVNASNVRVYIRFDTTATTISAFHWYMESNERWVVPEDMCPLAFNVIAASTGTGTLYSWAGLNA